MRIRLENAKRIGRKIGLNEEKGYAVAIFLALIIVSATVAGYYFWLRPQAEQYNTIYLLDTNKKAVDYTDVLVANQNSTFNVYVDVENHMLASASYQVQVKIVQNLPAVFPLDAPPNQIVKMSNVKNDGLPAEQTATITQNTPGNYSVVFELWKVQSDGSLAFTQNYCVLNIQVTD
jgi:uncharacterized membrane protein